MGLGQGEILGLIAIRRYEEDPIRADVIAVVRNALLNALVDLRRGATLMT